KNEISSPIQGTDEERCKRSGPFCSGDSTWDIPKVPRLKIVKRPTDACTAKNEISSPIQGTDEEKCEGSGPFCIEDRPGNFSKVVWLKIVIRPTDACTGT
ncbi:Hypothetical protein CINCED_3A019896, partial [Cinara cedri]